MAFRKKKCLGSVEAQTFVGSECSIYPSGHMVLRSLIRGHRQYFDFQ